MYFYSCQQYFEFEGFNGSLAEFEKECRSKNKSIVKLDRKVHGDEKRVMAQVRSVSNSIV